MTKIKNTTKDLEKKDYFTFAHSKDTYVYLGYSRTSDMFGDFYNIFNCSTQQIEESQHNEVIAYLGTYDKLVVK